MLNAAGLTGRPNVDWCETHKVETIRANVIGCLNLADVCLSKNLHMTYYGEGLLLVCSVCFLWIVSGAAAILERVNAPATASSKHHKKKLKK